MGDEAFREAMIQEFFDEAEAHFWAQCIDYVFVDGKRSDAMCEFVMYVFLTRVDNDWFKTEGRKWPKTFVQKLADHCLKKALSGEKTKSYEEIETAYVKLEEDRDKDGQITLVSADEDNIEDLPLSVLSRSIVHGKSSLSLSKVDSRQMTMQFGRPTLPEKSRSRPSSPSSGPAARGCIQKPFAMLHGGSSSPEKVWRHATFWRCTEVSASVTVRAAASFLTRPFVLGQIFPSNFPWLWNQCLLFTK